MMNKPLEKRNMNFFALEVKISREEMNGLKSKLIRNRSRMKENEWLQEYELIYLSQKYENWNLEETPSS